MTDTGGDSARSLARAQKCATSSELMPRSSKKWLSTDTCSSPTSSANASASAFSLGVGRRDIGLVGPEAA